MVMEAMDLKEQTLLEGLLEAKLLIQKLDYITLLYISTEIRTLQSEPRVYLLDSQNQSNISCLRDIPKENFTSLHGDPVTLRDLKIKFTQRSI
jgi:hypothetical protein